MKNEAVVVVNPAAGGGRTIDALPQLEHALTNLSLAYRVEITKNLAHAAELATTAGAANELVIALGGDGLVGCLAGALRPHKGRLAVIPSGRGNDFARVLGIPKDPDKAALVAVSGREALLDLAEANNKPFVGVASYGFDSEANRIANETRLIKGSAVYLYGALLTLLRWKPTRFTVELDGVERSFTGYSVAAANSKVYGGGMYIAPDAKLDDGLFDVVMIKQQRKLKFATSMRKVFTGKHVLLPEVEVVRARSVTLKAERPFEVYADGDPIGTTPLKATVLPQALRIMVPNETPS